MAIQLRRGAYEDFDPQKMKPAEVAVVRSGDPSSTDGKAVYVAISAGDVKRLVSDDEVQDTIYNETEEIINQIEQGVADTVAQVEAWVTGEVDGEPVPTTDPAYHNNAKYYAEQAAESARTLTTDDTLTHAGQAADAKAVGDKLTPLIGGDEQREITGWVHGKYINVANANIGDTVDITNIASYFSLKYVIVDCEEGDRFLLNLAGAASARAWAFLTSNNILISRADASVTLTDVIITAPQNAQKAVFQCIYRPEETDTTTDNGTAYKIVQGSGNIVRFDIVQDKTETQKAIARENIGITSSGEGLSDEAKTALLNCFRHVAWIDTHGQDYYDALYNALYGGIAPSENINVVFNNTIERTFYTDDPLDTLKPHLTVSHNGAVVTNYDLVGSFSQNNIRVKIGNEYSGIIQVQPKSPKYTYSISSGDLVFLSKYYPNGTVSDDGSLPWAQPNNIRGLIGSREGRAKYGYSSLYLIPVPADCTTVTVTMSNGYMIGLTRYFYNQSTKMYAYVGDADPGWTELSVTSSIPMKDLRAVSINVKKSDNGTMDSGPSECVIKFS